MADTAVETSQPAAAAIEASDDKKVIAAEEAAAMTDKEKEGLEAKAAADGNEDTAQKTEEKKSRTLKAGDTINYLTSMTKRLTLGRKSGTASKKAVDAAAAADAAVEQESEQGEAKAEVEPKKCTSPKVCKETVPPPPSVHKKDYKPDVVYLYQFSRASSMPSVSPYCLKTETWLKLQKIPYESVEHQNKLRSKRGLLPFVELNGEEIYESDVIINKLGEMFKKELDTGMSSKDKSVQHAMVTMVDNHLNWCYTHWSVRDVNNTIRGYKVSLKDMMHSIVPNSALTVVMKFTYIRQTQKRLKSAGFGYYSNIEVDEMGQKDLLVLSDLLGDKNYFFGPEPRTLDIKVFVWLALFLCVDESIKCPLRDFMHEECMNLVSLFNRIKDRAWGEDWDKATGDTLELNPHLPKEVPEPTKQGEAEESEKGKADTKEEKKDEQTKAAATAE